MNGLNFNPNEKSVSTFLGKCKILKTLTLKDLYLCHNLLICILEGVSHNSTLQELHIRDKGISDNLAPTFGQMLQLNKNLNVLNLKENRGVGDQIASSIATALMGASSLTSLDLSETSITNLGLTLLCEMISRKTTITTFNIGPVANENGKGRQSLCDAFGRSGERTTSLNLGSWIIRGMYVSCYSRWSIRACLALLQKVQQLNRIYITTPLDSK